MNTGNTAKEFSADYTVVGEISTLANTVSSKVGSWSAGNYLTSAAAGDTTVSIGSQLEALDAAMGKQAANGNYIKANSETVSLASNIASLDAALGAKQSGNYISSSSSVNENLKALDTNLASVDSNAVHKSGNETVAGVKTFVDNVVFDITDGIKFGSSGTVIKGISDDAGTNSSNMIASTKAVYEAVHGEGSDVVHKSGEETLTGAKTFEAVTTFSGTKGIKFGTNGTVITGISDAVDSDSSNTIASSKALKAVNDRAVHITGNETIEGVKTFTGLVNANGGMDVRGVSRFYDNVVIGTNTSGGARSLTVNGTLSTTDLATLQSLLVSQGATVSGDLNVEGVTTLSSENGVKFEGSDTVIQGVSEEIDNSSDHTTVATAKAVYDLVDAEKAAREAADAQIRTDFAAADAAEKEAREAADAQIRTDFAAADAAEKAARDAADAQIRTDFAAADAAEKEAREAADAQIRTDFAAADAAEKAAREAADAQIRTDFAAADAQIRSDFEAADAALQTQITANADAIAAETTAREQADAALDVRVTALEDESGEQGEAIAELQEAVKVQKLDDEGHVIKTAGDYVDGLAHTVGENVLLLDEAIGSVDDGHYITASKDESGALQTTVSQNMEALDTQLYHTSEALGGGFDEETGVWSADLEVSTEEGSVHYGNFTTQKVTDALEQIITNIGTSDVLGTANGVSASNTVNANIAAVNTIIGDFSGLNITSTNITNGRPTDEGYKVPENVIEVLNNIDATLGTVHGLSDKLREANVYKGNLSDEGTVENHLTAVDRSIGDRSQMNNTTFDGYASIAGKDVASALTSVASNIGSAADLGDEMNGVSSAKTVNANIASVNSVVGDVSNLAHTVYASETSNVTDAIRALDSNIYRLDNQVADLGNKYVKLRKDMRSGMASMSAMSAMAPNSRANGDTQITLGTGLYAGYSAVAFGAYHWLTDNIMLNAGVAWGNSSDTIYRMGVSYTW
ncbi:MAG: YadA C-terminal domain-containing protein [Alphaproteobacteria bacterium]|nr:YadA C-terminal domain-containing protein [Alphaproteobacteria bacterium]